MTREEAITIMNQTKEVVCDYHRKAFIMAIKALEQESVLDNIRAEIKAVYKDRPDTYNHPQRTELYCEVLDIIDKYKAESEE